MVEIKKPSVIDQDRMTEVIDLGPDQEGIDLGQEVTKEGKGVKIGALIKGGEVDLEREIEVEEVEEVIAKIVTKFIRLNRVEDVAEVEVVPGRAVGLEGIKKVIENQELQNQGEANILDQEVGPELHQLNGQEGEDHLLE